MKPRLTDDPDDLEFEKFNEAGSIGSITTLDIPLPDDEVWAWQQEIRAKESRRIPLGFPIPEVNDDERSECW